MRKVDLRSCICYCVNFASLTVESVDLTSFSRANNTSKYWNSAGYSLYYCETSGKIAFVICLLHKIIVYKVFLCQHSQSEETAKYGQLRSFSKGLLLSASDTLRNFLKLAFQFFSCEIQNFLGQVSRVSFLLVMNWDKIEWLRHLRTSPPPPHPPLLQYCYIWSDQLSCLNHSVLLTYFRSCLISSVR